MSSAGCQIAALVSVYFMRRFQQLPGSVLNCGIGRTSPEMAIWQWLLPGVPVIGIDPRYSPRGHWRHVYHGRQIQAALGDGSTKSATYCGQCKSMLPCSDETHLVHMSAVQVITLDEVSANLPAPHFIWMDIDGSEPAALRGATETLKRTSWVNIEIHDKAYGQQHADEIGQLLRKAGFRLHYVQQDVLDRLYRRRGA